MTKNKMRRAFTLIELLVVIAIIGILAGILLPTLARAKMRSMTAQNKNNLKQIGYAATLFQGDNRDKTVGVADWTGKQFFGQYNGPMQSVDFSAGFLSNYVGGEARVWHDPLFNFSSQRAAGPACSYAFNYHYLNEQEQQGNWWDAEYKFWWRGISGTYIRKPALTLLFGDSARNWMGPLEENWFWTPPSEARRWPGWETAYTHFRHDGKSCVVWVDGHVETLGPDHSLPMDPDGMGYLCDTDDRMFRLLK